MTDDKKSNEPPCELELGDMPRPGSQFSAVSDKGTLQEDCGCIGSAEASQGLTFGRIDFNDPQYRNEGATIVVPSGDIGQLKGIVQNPQAYQAQLDKVIGFLRQQNPNLQFEALSANDAQKFAQTILDKHKEQGIDVDSVAPKTPSLPRNSFTKLCLNPKIG